MRISNIREHHHSLSHREAVESKLGISINTPSLFNHPPIQVWKELLEAFQKGATLAAGFDLPSGRVCREKALELLWSMSEAHNDVKREMLAADKKKSAGTELILASRLWDDPSPGRASSVKRRDVSGSEPPPSVHVGGGGARSAAHHERQRETTITTFIPTIIEYSQTGELTSEVMRSR